MMRGFGVRWVVEVLCRLRTMTAPSKSMSDHLSRLASQVLSPVIRRNWTSSMNRSPGVGFFFVSRPFAAARSFSNSSSVIGRRGSPGR
jgi:hypothetical protein